MQKMKTLEEQIKHLEAEFRTEHNTLRTNMDEQLRPKKDKIDKLKKEYQRETMKKLRSALPNTFYKRDDEYVAFGEYNKAKRAFKSVKFSKDINGVWNVEVSYVQCGTLVYFNWEQITKEEYKEAFAEVYETISDIL